MLAELDASAVRRWCSAADAALAARQAEIDGLNVYPIPDGDTGTNLSLTMRSAAEAVDSDRSPTAGGVLAAMARGAVLGARGNSGVIVSQLLRGIADGFTDEVAGDGITLAAALRRACDAAYAAVAEPVEGTILSVAHAAAEAARSAAVQRRGDLAATVTAAAEAAGAALARTPQQLDVLARAGVVDAGGQGLVVLLDALAEVLTGESPERERVGRPRTRAVREAAREAGSEDFAYEVQYLLHARDEAVEPLRATLLGLGDSVAIVGAGPPQQDGTTGLFNVHAHVNDVGAAIEAGIEAGRPHRITVIRFAEQRAAEAVEQLSGTAVVAVAPGEGLADLFRSEGVLVVDGGPTSSPSSAEVLDVVMASEAARVVLLPNASAVGGVAEIAARQARERGLEVAVVPTKSPVQGLAAVAMHDSSRRFADDVIAMAEAAAATRFAEVTIAVSASITYAGRCEAGDVLGLIDGEVVQIGSSVVEVGIGLLDRLIGAGGELITVLAGADPDAPEAAAAVEAHVRQHYPLVEITGFAGGQPHYPLLIGVE
jgi:hypothetical protein